ncbi:uncharacterized protein BCR38DRAFT_448753 [Pseudomassariella vexata]|uniref:Uncharacterized protein n=1 Tax=Pseudomassariella vexata TaxID=1141098 RepID=A0A1Y2DEW3_9PEZI|nr:uncharacterized protein BCR38DRAFT_448753 [Pseudomassariella vexata]ORY57820.1 hypothetical protein BCR38DRAFT_448753 [Pseudomassariella vexata]
MAFTRHHRRLHVSDVFFLNLAAQPLDILVLSTPGQITVMNTYYGKPTCNSKDTHPSTLQLEWLEGRHGISDWYFFMRHQEQGQHMPDRCVQCRITFTNRKTQVAMPVNGLSSCVDGHIKARHIFNQLTFGLQLCVLAHSKRNRSASCQSINSTRIIPGG